MSRCAYSVSIKGFLRQNRTIHKKYQSTEVPCVWNVSRENRVVVQAGMGIWRMVDYAHRHHRRFVTLVGPSRAYKRARSPMSLSRTNDKQREMSSPLVTRRPLTLYTSPVSSANWNSNNGCRNLDCTPHLPLGIQDKAKAVLWSLRPSCIMTAAQTAGWHPSRAEPRMPDDVMYANPLLWPILQHLLQKILQQSNFFLMQSHPGLFNHCTFIFRRRIVLLAYLE